MVVPPDLFAKNWGLEAVGVPRSAGLVEGGPRRRAHETFPGEERSHWPWSRQHFRPGQLRCGRARRCSSPMRSTKPATGLRTPCAISGRHSPRRSTTRSQTSVDLEADLLFFDTSSTYFETGTADEPTARDDRPADPRRTSHRRRPRRRIPHPRQEPKTTATIFPRSSSARSPPSPVALTQRQQVPTSARRRSSRVPNSVAGAIVGH
jgi:hypothetical protein